VPCRPRLECTDERFGDLCPCVSQAGHVRWANALTTELPTRRLNADEQSAHENMGEYNVSNLLNQPLPHGDFVAMIDERIERLEVQARELRAVLTGYFAGVAQAESQHERVRAGEVER
jgi:hypothetical protein